MLNYNVYIYYNIYIYILYYNIYILYYIIIYIYTFQAIDLQHCQCFTYILHLHGPYLPREDPCAADAVALRARLRQDIAGSNCAEVRQDAANGRIAIENGLV